MVARMLTEADMNDNPAELIRRVHQISVALFTDTMRNAAINLTPVQFSALKVLRDQPRVDQATVASLIGYDRATLGKVIDRLVDRGLVHRTVSERDRRARELLLTSSGEEVLNEAMPLVQSMQSQLLSELAPSDAESFKATLKQLTQLSQSNSMESARA